MKLFQNLVLLMFLFGTGALPILGQSLPYIMDMVYNNPGEEKTITKYNDPYYRKSQGFTSSVPHWYINCAITYDGFEGGRLDLNSEERTWIEELAKWIDVKLDACEKAGIDVYPFTDFIVFPKSVWHKYGNQITGVGGGEAATQATIEVSCVYGRIKSALIEQMWRMMLYHAQGEPDKNYDLIQLRDTLEKYDKLWEEWRQLAKEPSCATIYTDMAFRNKVEGSIGELAEEIRQMIKE